MDAPLLTANFDTKSLLGTELALIREAQTDPQRAWATASAERNRHVRLRLQGMVLRLWAAADSAAAVDAYVRLKLDERINLGPDLWRGCVSDPGRAVALARTVIAADKGVSQPDYAKDLVTALGEAGAHNLAIEFARESAARNDSLLREAVKQWGESHPLDALARLGELDVPDELKSSLRGEVILAWSADDPAGLVRYASEMPSSQERQQALNLGLRNWTAEDPTSAIAWYSRQAPSLELDGLPSALASSLTITNPEHAISWARQIHDPARRANVLMRVTESWARSNPNQVKSFMTQSPSLPAPDRATMESALELLKQDTTEAAP